MEHSKFLPCQLRYNISSASCKVSKCKILKSNQRATKVQGINMWSHLSVKKTVDAKVTAVIFCLFQNFLCFFFFVSIVSLMVIVNGVMVCWCSTCIDLLISDESPLPTGKITLDEASWVASLLQLGAMIANTYFGYITNNFGRKWPLLFVTIPMIVCSIVSFLVQ